MTLISVASLKIHHVSAALLEKAVQASVGLWTDGLGDSAAYRSSSGNKAGFLHLQLEFGHLYRSKYMIPLKTLVGSASSFTKCYHLHRIRMTPLLSYSGRIGT